MTVAEKIARRVKTHNVGYSKQLRYMRGEYSVIRKLYSGRKDDPATRVEVRVDHDVFDEELALTRKSKKERKKTVY